VFCQFDEQETNRLLQAREKLAQILCGVAVSYLLVRVAVLQGCGPLLCSVFSMQE
jgi:hypothetical protein